MSTENPAPNPLRLLRLMQLVSPALPVGAFSFSQGLEYAVEAGWITTEGDIAEWLDTLMRESLGRVDLPLLWRCLNALTENDRARFSDWNDYCLASRETAEFYHADKEMGKALLRLLTQLHNANDFPPVDEMSFVAAFALAVRQWDISTPEAMAGYLWSWLENQVTAATKIVPFGQSVSQRLLWTLAERMPPVLEQAMVLRDEELGGSLPRLAISSALHETQYTRLYRS